MNDFLPQRKRLPHEVPPWVADGAVFFITLNAKPRGGAPLLEKDRPLRLWENARRQMEAGRWWVRLFLVMPDHVHLMAAFPANPGMKAVMMEWKRWTARTFPPVASRASVIAAWRRPWGRTRRPTASPTAR